ncbi:hypothetical protein H1R17_01310 [Flavobacterium sp. xlx-214]|uniref:hypothetical protein n=1 Tax=unclassified Flavobacterium TaxID=196869 RepID=UPI0013D8DC27|nr:MULTISPECIES: hypothetical protein [unclassified Flavobacterium]MBA5792658.1 hypothetical protein [Flavobacterium sp. xlx-221]QMI83806.1 hypothetical protein H1R17_01310 [Flavobacterium sp. xlx-214]
MKNIILILSIINFFYGYPQEKYQAFQYENKFGVVDKTSLEEIVPPTYASFAPVFQDVLAFVDKDKFYFYDENTGVTSIYIDRNQPILIYKMGIYFHCVNNDKSVLISSSKFSNKIFFNREYERITTVYQNIMGFTKTNSIDVYKKGDYNTQYLKDVSATFFEFEHLYDIKNQKEVSTYIFYGKDNIYIYDENFELLNSIASSESDYKKILQLIAGDYKKIDQDWKTDGWGNISIWNVKNEKGITVFSVDGFDFSFSVKGNFDKSTLSLSKFYLDVRDINYWVVIKNIETQMEYCFKIDLKNKTFFYPKKYQKKLKLQML